ncbi:MAG: hypothetical protein H6745_09760 [Deltaproteobacteria bacterium]|nr:hypothetical protein [Deltaproteobacteria bacterium]
MANAAPTDPESEPPNDARRGLFWPFALLSVLLLLPALWLAAYFWANSTPGREALMRILTKRLPPSVVTVGAVHWGPAPAELELLGVVLADEHGAPAIRADAVTAELALDDLVFRGETRLAGIRVRDYLVRLEWADDGSLNVARAVAKSAAPKPPGPATPKPPPKLMVLDHLELEHGEVRLAGPGWELAFDDVTARGGVRLGGDVGLAIAADLSAAASHGAWKDGKRRVAADTVKIDGFSWEGAGFTVRELALAAEGGLATRLGGKMTFGDAPALEASGDAALPGALAAELGLGEVLPQGASATTLVMKLAGETLDASCGGLAAPEVALGPVRLAGARGAVKTLRYAPGVLKPSGGVQLADLHADRVDAPDDVVAKDVTIGSVAVTVEGRSQVDVTGIRAASFAFGDDDAGAVSGKLSGSMGLTSGSLEGSVETASGDLGATGTIRVNPLRGSLKVELRVVLERVAGAVATKVMSYVPDEVRATVKPPLSGLAVFETVLAKREDEETGKKAWRAETEVTEARLAGDPETYVYDGTSWARAVAEVPGAVAPP